MQIAQGKMGRVAVFRLAPGEDVLEGLTKACDELKINNGLILSGIGSLDGATFFDPVILPEKKSKYGYGNPLVLYGPIELVSMSGMICQNDSDGKTLLHVHFALTDQYGNAHGGHLMEGNKVLFTVDAMIAEVEGIKMGRRFDNDLGVFLFNPSQK